MKTSHRLVVGTLVSLVFALLSPFLAAAQSSNVIRGLSITPFLMERQMQKGQTSQELIDITNTSDRVLPVDISVNDFYPSGQNGEPVFVDEGKGDPHYSLSSWIQILSNPKPTLAPGEKTSLRFSITPPANAEDGGHYGAILFTFQTGQVSGTAVAVAQKLGAIILAKLGKVKEDGYISSIKASHWFSEYPPVDLTTTFYNTGNVHVKPRGAVSIYNMFGKKVGSVLVNENANNVLAQTDRSFISTWKDSFAFGPYTAKAELAYGDSGQVASASTTFWVIPWKTTLVVAIIIFILLFLFRWFINRYNRYILGRAEAMSRARRK